MEKSIAEIFKTDKPLIGMVHVRAMPGTPAYGGDLDKVIQTAVTEAKLLADLGLDGILLENMHDVPYLNGGVGPEITAAMAAVALKVREAFASPIGIQILAGANREAISVALAAKLDFVRVEGFVFGHVADEGWLDAQAGELLRYRRQIDAQHIPVWTDIKKKHSAHAITADVDIAETAHAAEFSRSDALILTGSATGNSANTKDLQCLKEATRLPVVIGSGIGPDNLLDYWEADAFIVGSSLKEGGRWNRDIDPVRVQRLVETARFFRRQNARKKT